MAAGIGEIGIGAEAGARTGKRRIADEARTVEIEVVAEKVTAKTERSVGGENPVALRGAVAMIVERMVDQAVVLALRGLENVAGREASVKSHLRKAGKRIKWHLLQNLTRNMKLRKVRLTTLGLPMFLHHPLLYHLRHHLPNHLPCLLNLLPRRR